LIERLKPMAGWLAGWRSGKGPVGQRFAHLSCQVLAPNQYSEQQPAARL